MPGRKIPEAARRDEILRAAYRVAARDRLGGLTVRAVATEAGVSAGLLLFHFESKDGLLVDLLDWMLAHTIVAGELHRRPPADVPPEQWLLGLVERDLRHLLAQRDRIELFYDYWVLGTRHPVIRRLIRRALHRYRESFRPAADAVCAAHPTRFAALAADDLAGVCAAFIEGCATQTVLDPDRFDAVRAMATLHALVLDPLHAPRLTRS
jgi:TetR/AcrR family transcriptional repressor of bet genes